MADNTRGGSQDGANPLIATDEVTYSGDTADVQLVRVVSVSGAEGSRTVSDIDSSSGLVVQPYTANGSPLDTPNELTTDGQADNGMAGVPNVANWIHNGSTWDRARGNTEGQFAQGSVAHDSPDAGNSVKVGGKVGTSVNPTAVATGDRTDAHFDTKGRIGVWLASAYDGSSSIDGATLADTLAGGVGLRTGANLLIFNGSTWDRARGDITNGLDVDVTRLPALPTGTNNIGDVDVLTMPNVTLAAGTNTNEVVGDIAHDTGVGGNPVQVAGAAQDMDDTAPPNRVSTEADVTRFATDRDGAQFVHPHGPQIWSYHLDTSSAQTDTTVHASPGSGLSLYVTDIVFSSGAATAINLFFEEGSTKVLGPYYLEATAGRGMALHFNTPKKITAATALTLTTSAAIAHTVDVTGWVGQG